jgi:Zn ribbon nucleic-acid-binding protein
MTKRFIVITVECPRCKVRQKIHIAARPGPTLVAAEMVRCLNCDHHFETSVPDKIVAGPFPA